MTLMNSSAYYTLLAPLSNTELQEAIHTKKVKVKNYMRNQMIYLEGDACKTADIILNGKVAVERIDENGNLLTIAEFLPDDLLGGNLIFSKNPYYPMTVTAKSKTTLLEINQNYLFELCHQNPEFLRTFLQYISDHALLLGDKIKHHINRSIREGLITYIAGAMRLQNSTQIRLDMTKKELAERMGVQRTSLSRELQKMKQENLIEYDSKIIRVKNKDYFLKP